MKNKNIIKLNFAISTHRQNGKKSVKYGRGRTPDQFFFPAR
jgi:hypothetical protein